MGCKSRLQFVNDLELVDSIQKNILTKNALKKDCPGLPSFHVAQRGKLAREQKHFANPTLVAQQDEPPICRINHQPFGACLVCKFKLVFPFLWLSCRMEFPLVEAWCPRHN